MKQFIERYLDSPVSGVAFSFLLIAIVLARLSINRGDWWMPYLQGLSTTFICLSLEILVINGFLEMQRELLGDQLRKTRETVISKALGRVTPHLDGWIPQHVTPASRHIQQLEWARRKVDKLRESSSELAVEVHDTQYRQALEDFTNKADELCDKIESLVNLIHTDAKPDLLNGKLNEVLVAANEFKQQADVVLNRLDGFRGGEGTA